MVVRYFPAATLFPILIILPQKVPDDSHESAPESTKEMKTHCLSHVKIYRAVGQIHCFFAMKNSLKRTCIQTVLTNHPLTNESSDHPNIALASELTLDGS